MLDIHENIVLLRGRKKFLMVLKQLDRWLCDEDVHTAFDRVKSDRIVSSVRGKYGDCITVSHNGLFFGKVFVTYSHCPWVAHLSPLCMHLDLSCPLWGTLRRRHPIRCMLLKCSSANVHLEMTELCAIQRSYGTYGSRETCRQIPQPSQVCQPFRVF
jgi:hypothetical protein